MKILRIEELHYHILYVEDGKSVSAYKKMGKKWEKWDSDWRDLKDKNLIIELEKLLEDKLQKK